MLDRNVLIVQLLQETKRRDRLAAGAKTILAKFLGDQLQSKLDSETTKADVFKRELNVRQGVNLHSKFGYPWQ